LRCKWAPLHKRFYPAWLESQFASYRIYLNARWDFSYNLALIMWLVLNSRIQRQNNRDEPDCSEPDHKEPSNGLHHQIVTSWHQYNPLTLCRRCDSTLTKQCA
jgi:hypothetical protein